MFIVKGMNLFQNLAHTIDVVHEGIVFHHEKFLVLGDFNSSFLDGIRQTVQYQLAKGLSGVLGLDEDDAIEEIGNYIWKSFDKERPMSKFELRSRITQYLEQEIL